jgi:hypothetical protein
VTLSYTINEEIWLYPGHGAWHFITLPVEYAQEIKILANPIKKGFGSIKVSVTIGTLTWDTSIFPDSKSKSYLLPLKKEVRLKCKLQPGDKVKVSIYISGLDQ